MNWVWNFGTFPRSLVWYIWHSIINLDFRNYEKIISTTPYQYNASSFTSTNPVKRFISNFIPENIFFERERKKKQKVVVKTTVMQDDCGKKIIAIACFNRCVGHFEPLFCYYSHLSKRTVIIAGKNDHFYCILFHYSFAAVKRLRSTRVQYLTLIGPVSIRVCTKHFSKMIINVRHAARSLPHLVLKIFFIFTEIDVALHWFWWRMLETVSVGDNFESLSPKSFNVLK